MKLLQRQHGGITLAELAYYVALVVLISWMMVATCLGQEKYQTRTGPFCRVYNQQGRSSDVGSGTLVDTNQTGGLVLTCAHIFTDRIGRIECEFAGRRYQARFISLDETHHDLAAVELTEAIDVPPIRLGAFSGEGTYVVCGFGPVGQFRKFAGQLTGLSQARYADAVFSTPIRQGDSGAGTINSQGELVGVAWGTNRTRCRVTCGRPVINFLRSVVNCPPGSNCYRNPSPRFMDRLRRLDPRFREPQQFDQGPQPQPEPFVAPQPETQPSVDLSGILARLDELESRPLPKDYAPRLQQLEDTLSDMAGRITNVDSRISQIPQPKDYSEEIRQIEQRMPNVQVITDRIAMLEQKMSAGEKQITQQFITITQQLAQLQALPEPPTTEEVADKVIDQLPEPPDEQRIVETVIAAIPKERERVLYFTSTKGCDACSDVDERIEELRQSGYPVSIIDLDPAQLKVAGVPRLYHTVTGQSVHGAKDCLNHITWLTRQ